MQFRTGEEFGVGIFLLLLLLLLLCPHLMLCGSNKFGSKDRKVQVAAKFGEGSFGFVTSCTRLGRANTQGTHLFFFNVLTRTQRTRANFNPQHCFLYHMGLYKFEFEQSYGKSKFQELFFLRCYAL